MVESRLIAVSVSVGNGVPSPIFDLGIPLSLNSCAEVNEVDPVI